MKRQVDILGRGPAHGVGRGQTFEPVLQLSYDPASLVRQFDGNKRADCRHNNGDYTRSHPCRQTRVWVHFSLGAESEIIRGGGEADE